MMFLGVSGQNDAATQELLRDIESSSDEDTYDKDGNLVKRASPTRKSVKVVKKNQQQNHQLGGEGTPARSEKLKSMDVVQWLKKRCQKTAKTSSLLSSNEIERNKDIMQIFEHFDEDKSGQLEVNEVIGMLEENGMKMSKKHALEFFDVLDADKSGGLTINEFKEFLFSEDCRESKLWDFNPVEFRKLMRRVRAEQHRMLIGSETEKDLMDCSFGQYLPFTFEEMLQYIHKLSRRNLIMSRIKSPLSAKDKEETRQNIVNYVRLFKAYKYLVGESASDAPTFLKFSQQHKNEQAKTLQKSPEGLLNARHRNLAQIINQRRTQKSKFYPNQMSSFVKPK